MSSGDGDDHGRFKATDRKKKDDNDSGGGSGGHSGGSTSIGKIPQSALVTDALPGKSVIPIMNELREVLISEVPGVLLKVKNILANFSETQIGMLTIDDLIGSPFTNNIPFGMGNWHEINMMTGQGGGVTLCERIPSSRTMCPFPIGLYNTLLMDVEALIAFLAPGRDTMISPKYLATALAHAALRMSIGEGNLVGLQNDNYVLRLKGCKALKVSSNRSINMMGYLPASLCTSARMKIRSSLHSVSTTESYTAPADGGDGAAPASGSADGAAPPRYARLVIVSILTHNTPFEVADGMSEMYRNLYNATTLTTSPKQRRFMYKLLHTILAPLFMDIADMPDDIYDLDHPTAFTEVDLGSLREVVGPIADRSATLAPPPKKRRKMVDGKVVDVGTPDRPKKRGFR
jgi:hypothetical protein